MMTRLSLRTVLFGTILLGLTALAMAHHGNPQTPTPTSNGWQGSLPPGVPAPSSPALPGG
jgi:hypothetical protein